MRILAVDDSDVVRDLVPTLFKDTPFPPVRVSESGAAALELLTRKREQFDCFILDIEMPEMDGIALCREIRQIEAYKDAPIIMLTSRTDGTTIERAFAAGANDYIFKRFDPKTFTERVFVAERYMRKNTGALRVSAVQGNAQMPSRKHDFTFEQEFMIEGVDRMILPFSLGNYISQLPAEDRNACQVFAVHIDNARDLYALGRTQDYVSILKTIAVTIIDELSSLRLLLSYNGAGVFICVVRSPDVLNSAALAQAIFQRVMDAAVHTQYGWTIRPRISVGKPVAPSASRNLMVRNTFDRATERATAPRTSTYGEPSSL
jgi:CheY-like chemotaxis protein